MEGVTFVVPVHNGAAWLRDTLGAIYAQLDHGPFEVIVVDDHSGDGSWELLRELRGHWPFRLLAGPGRGAAAAVNTGIRAARFPIICQVDQDVIVQPGWMALLRAELADPTVGAVQGYYVSEASSALCARAMSLDLEYRYSAIDGRETDHVCTGNSAYRADALRRVGLFDETFGYGYDNDVSYRLRAAGYRLKICRAARSVHRWREGLMGYCVQQYGFGYGRLDIVAKHPRRVIGDSVSPAGMMLHPLLMASAVVSLLMALILATADLPWRLSAVAAVTVILGLAVERLVAGLRAARRFRDPTPLVFPFLHLIRDLAWVVAIGMWLVRRIGGRPPKPSHSMHARPTADATGVVTQPDFLAD